MGRNLGAWGGREKGKCHITIPPVQQSHRCENDSRLFWETSLEIERETDFTAPPHVLGPLGEETIELGEEGMWVSMGRRGFLYIWLSCESTTSFINSAMTIKTSSCVFTSHSLLALLSSCSAPISYSSLFLHSLNCTLSKCADCICSLSMSSLVHCCLWMCDS